MYCCRYFSKLKRQYWSCGFDQRLLKLESHYILGVPLYHTKAVGPLRHAYSESWYYVALDALFSVMLQDLNLPVNAVRTCHLKPLPYQNICVAFNAMLNRKIVLLCRTLLLELKDITFSYCY